MLFVMGVGIIAGGCSSVKVQDVMHINIKVKEIQLKLDELADENNKRGVVG